LVPLEDGEFCLERETALLRLAVAVEGEEVALPWLLEEETRPWFEPPLTERFVGGCDPDRDGGEPLLFDVVLRREPGPPSWDLAEPFEECRDERDPLASLA